MRSIIGPDETTTVAVPYRLQCEPMEFFYDIARYAYLHNALAACILSGIACGIMGTYVVCRRTVFLAGGITHASFGGLGIAFYLGLNPIACLLYTSPSPRD